jgi:hypothetical protein
MSLVLEPKTSQGRRSLEREPSKSESARSRRKTSPPQPRKSHTVRASPRRRRQTLTPAALSRLSGKKVIIGDLAKPLEYAGEDPLLLAPDWNPHNVAPSRIVKSFPFKPYDPRNAKAFESRGSALSLPKTIRRKRVKEVEMADGFGSDSDDAFDNTFADIMVKRGERPLALAASSPIHMRRPLESYESSDSEDEEAAYPWTQASLQRSSPIPGDPSSLSMGKAEVSGADAADTRDASPEWMGDADGAEMEANPANTTIDDPAPTTLSTDKAGVGADIDPADTTVEASFESIDELWVDAGPAETDAANITVDKVSQALSIGEADEPGNQAGHADLTGRGQSEILDKVDESANADPAYTADRSVSSLLCGASGQGAGDDPESVASYDQSASMDEADEIGADAGLACAAKPSGSSLIGDVDQTVEEADPTDTTLHDQSGMVGEAEEPEADTDPAYTAGTSVLDLIGGVDRTEEEADFTDATLHDQSESMGEAQGSGVDVEGAKSSQHPSTRECPASVDIIDPEPIETVHTTESIEASPEDSIQGIARDVAPMQEQEQIVIDSAKAPEYLEQRPDGTMAEIASIAAGLHAQPEPVTVIAQVEHNSQDRPESPSIGLSGSTHEPSDIVERRKARDHQEIEVPCTVLEPYPVPVQEHDAPSMPAATAVACTPIRHRLRRSLHAGSTPFPSSAIAPPQPPAIIEQADDLSSNGPTRESSLFVQAAWQASSDVEDACDGQASDTDIGWQELLKRSGCSELYKSAVQNLQRNEEKQSASRNADPC